jgi:hypothetical protein
MDSCLDVFIQEARMGFCFGLQHSLRLKTDLVKALSKGCGISISVLKGYKRRPTLGKLPADAVVRIDREDVPEKREAESEEER